MPASIGVYDFDTGVVKRTAPVRVRPAPPAPPPAQVAVQARSSVTQHGVTFTFDQAYVTGQFVNLDWWVLPAAPGGTVTVTEISPAYDAGQTVHGWMVNPSSMTENAYDGRLATTGVRVVPGWNPALLPTLPLAAAAGSSIVKTVSAAAPTSTSASGHKPGLQTAVVLTVLDTEPAADAFRPPYYGTSKPLFTYSQVVQANLPSLAPPAVGGPTLDSIAGRFQRVQLDHYWQWQSRYMHPADNFRSVPGVGAIANYGADMAVSHNNAILRLMLNDATWAQKKDALVRVLQAGIDWYGTAKAGGKWYADGGHMAGRKVMILFAALMFDHADMKTVVANPAWDAFSENGHVYASATALANGVRGGALYGRPEPAAGNYWQRIELRKGKRDLRDPTGQVDGGDDPGYAYQNILTGGYAEAALIVRLLGAESVWNHTAFLDYIDRYLTVGVHATPDTEAARRPLIAARHGVINISYRSPFCAAMWTAHRGVIA